MQTQPNLAILKALLQDEHLDSWQDNLDAIEAMPRLNSFRTGDEPYKFFYQSYDSFIMPLIPQFLEGDEELTNMVNNEEPRYKFLNIWVWVED